MYAGNVGYFNTLEEVGHEDDSLRTLAASLFWRFHTVSENWIAQFTIPARLGARGTGRETARKASLRWFTELQSSLMKIYLEAITQMMSKMGGKDVWKATTPKQRAEVFGLIWLQDPKAMAAAMNGPAASSIPINDIYSDVTAAHVKWQKVFEKVFTWTCEQTFVIRLADEEPKEKLYMWFKGIMYNPYFGPGGLDLGGVDKIPVRRM